MDLSATAAFRRQLPALGVFGIVAMHRTAPRSDFRARLRPKRANATEAAGAADASLPLAINLSKNP